MQYSKLLHALWRYDISWTLWESVPKRIERLSCQKRQKTARAIFAANSLLNGVAHSGSASVAGIAATIGTRQFGKSEARRYTQSRLTSRADYCITLESKSMLHIYLVEQVGRLWMLGSTPAFKGTGAARSVYSFLAALCFAGQP
jgi:hypothetical protein